MAMFRMNLIDPQDKRVIEGLTLLVVKDVLVILGYLVFLYCALWAVSEMLG